MRRRARDGDEQAALTVERKHLLFKPGQRKAIKQRVNRRERRADRRNNNR